MTRSQVRTSTEKLRLCKCEVRSFFFASRTWRLRPRILNAARRGKRGRIHCFAATGLPLLPLLPLLLWSSGLQAQPRRLDTTLRAMPGSTPAANTSMPLAGWHNGLFYLRDTSDVFRFYPSGRLHVDGVHSLAPGVDLLPAGQALLPTLWLRRARLEFAAEFYKFQVVVMGEFGPSAIDNSNGRAATEDCTPNLKAGAPACTPRASAIDAPSHRASIVNAYVNYAASTALNIQGGQFRVPFGLENRTGANVTPFMERSMASRLIGASGRDIGLMAWGELFERLDYSVGIFTGDGADRRNVDARFDAFGRVSTRPFATSHEKTFRGIQFGVSGSKGSRDPKRVGYDAPTLTTQAGFGYFRPTYRDSGGRTMHIIPADDQTAAAFELYAPLGPLDLQAELIRVRYSTREAADLQQLQQDSAREGRIAGFAYYLQAGLWVLGSREFLGRPGTMNPPHADFKIVKPQPRHAVEVLVKFEQLRLHYDGAARGGTVDGLTPSGHIRVNAGSVGVNVWTARHVRLTANYILYDFPGSAPVSPSSANGPKQGVTQRALAPSQWLDKGAHDGARDDAHSLHELSFRVGVQF
jgi:phosphate-selective porin